MTQSVNVSGTVLSALLFELNNAEYDKEGLILGRISNVVTDSITDSSINDVRHETVYTIMTFLPAKQMHTLFGWSGQVKEEELNKSCHPHSNTDIIGWYKLRRQSSTAVSLRERAVHYNIQRWLEEKTRSRTSGSRSLGARSGTDDTKALFLLCIAGSNHSRTLHSADHIFMTRTGLDRTWCYLPLKVPNLSSTAQPEYRVNPLHDTTQHGACADIINRSKSQFLNKDNELHSVCYLKQLNEKLHKKLQTVCSELIKVEETAEKKRNRIEELMLEISLAKDSVAQNCKQFRDMRRSSKTRGGLRVDKSPVRADPNLIDFDSDEENKQTAAAKNKSKESGKHSETSTACDKGKHGVNGVSNVDLLGQLDHEEQKSKAAPSGDAVMKNAEAPLKTTRSRSGKKTGQENDIGQSKLSTHNTSQSKQATHDVSQSKQATHDISQSKQATHDVSQSKQATHDISQSKQATHDISQSKQATHDASQSNQSAHNAGKSKQATHSDLAVNGTAVTAASRTTAAGKAGHKQQLSDEGTKQTNQLRFEKADPIQTLPVANRDIPVIVKPPKSSKLGEK